MSHSLINTTPTLALLLAANAQGNAAARGAWNDGPVPGDLPATPQAYLQHAALASSMAAGSHPLMHREEAAMADHHLTASDLASHYMSHDLVPTYINSAAFLPQMAPEPWLGLTDGLFQSSVPTLPPVSSSLHVPTALQEATAAATLLGFGPQRHNQIRDIRYGRHSPY